MVRLPKLTVSTTKPGSVEHSYLRRELPPLKITNWPPAISIARKLSAAGAGEDVLRGSQRVSTTTSMSST